MRKSQKAVGKRCGGKQQQKSKGGKENKPPLQCYNCKGYGHPARLCPHKGKGQAPMEVDYGRRPGHINTMAQSDGQPHCLPQPKMLGYYENGANMYSSNHMQPTTQQMPQGQFQYQHENTQQNVACNQHNAINNSAIKIHGNNNQ